MVGEQLPSTVVSPEVRIARVRQFALLMAIILSVVAVFPSFVAYLGRPSGSSYLGVQYNTDDHMVYAAWMRQAMAGSLLFDNRFTTDFQPGLTFHAYFWLLGQVARVTGIVLAMAIARFAFTFLFVVALGRLLLKLDANVFVCKLALSFACLGGGLGFLMWQSFGVNASFPLSGIVQALTLGRLPIDVWQPEAFTFPSMLTNGLFMVSLCLILLLATAVIDAQEGWAPVPIGFFASMALMNIHSYDCLLVALVMAAFLVVTLAQRQASFAWVVRCLAMGAGAVLPALWFLHVLKSDPVFQARAATETFSPNFRAVMIGLLPALLLLAVGSGLTAGRSLRRIAGAVLLVVGLLAMFVAAQSHQEGYWMGPPPWAGAFCGAIIVAVLLRSDNPTYNLFLAWAMVGLVAPYFPALFQRKLAMGLAVPLGVMAAYGLAAVMRMLDRAPRNMIAVLAILTLSGSSLRWFFREFGYIGENVSNTTVHPVYLSHDATRIMSYLSERDETRTVVVAMPGVPLPTENPDVFRSPYLPDLNPILSGLAGVYTYAGHWSETPNYAKRRNEAIRNVFMRSATDGRRAAFLSSIRADYLVAPRPEAFTEIPLADLTQLGEVVVQGTQFDLVKLR